MNKPIETVSWEVCYDRGGGWKACWYMMGHLWCTWIVCLLYVCVLNVCICCLYEESRHQVIHACVGFTEGYLCLFPKDLATMTENPLNYLTLKFSNPHSIQCCWIPTAFRLTSTVGAAGCAVREALEFSYILRKFNNESQVSRDQQKRFRSWARKTSRHHKCCLISVKNV